MLRSKGIGFDAPREGKARQSTLFRASFAASRSRAGAIRISFSCVRSAKPLSSPCKYVLLCVSDAGTGMSREGEISGTVISSIRPFHAALPASATQVARGSISLFNRFSVRIRSLPDSCPSLHLDSDPPLRLWPRRGSGKVQ